MNAKRHLPVLRDPSENDGPKLSKVEQVLVGALGIFLLWLPLVMVGLFTASRLVRFLPDLSKGLVSSFVTLGPVLMSFALSSFFGGALVGRYGVRRSDRFPVYSGWVAVVGIVGLGTVQGALRPFGFALLVFGVLALLSTIFTYFGGRWGKRFRA
jgi:hypothetical protein